MSSLDIVEDRHEKKAVFVELSLPDGRRLDREKVLELLAEELNSMYSDQGRFYVRQSDEWTVHFQRAEQEAVALPEDRIRGRLAIVKRDEEVVREGEYTRNGKTSLYLVVSNVASGDEEPISGALPGFYGKIGVRSFNLAEKRLHPHSRLIT